LLTWHAFSLPPQALQKEAAASAAAVADRAARRVAAAATRAQAGPSRLGKRRYIPEPIAVQLTEEVTGSLRRLVSVPTLVRDRYKSLQRRELIEPRAAAVYKRSRSYIGYEPGAKGSAETAMHEATVAEKAEKAEKAAEARAEARAAAKA
jgi:nucleolar protein 53